MIVTEDKDLSVDQAAKRLGVHPNTVRNAIETGRMQARKVLGRWRIKESEVERIMRGTPSTDDQQDDDR